MDKLSSFFTGIGDYLNATTWFPLVQWPFWTLVVILAFCGVYTARFGKKSLMTLAFENVLKLTFIYLAAGALYIWMPSVLSSYSQLPFFYVSDDALSLVNPLGLLYGWDVALPRMMVRLYMLLYFLNIASITIDYKPVNFITWFFFQGLVFLAAMFFYTLFYKAVNSVMRGNADVLYQVMCILLLLGFSILLAMKLSYSITFISKKNNPGFEKTYKFLTQQNFGKQFTVTTIAFLIVMVYLVLAALTGHSSLVIDSVSPFAYLVNSFMCIFTLYIFTKLFNG